MKHETCMMYNMYHDIQVCYQQNTSVALIKEKEKKKD